MADFKVNVRDMGKCASREQEIVGKIAFIERELSELLGSLSVHSASAASIKRMLNHNMQGVKSCGERLHVLSDVLTEAQRVYEEAERKILDQGERQRLDGKLKDLADKLRTEEPVLGVEEPGCYGGDPVNLCNGNYIYEKVFLCIDGVIPLEFRIFYNSLKERMGAMGAGWGHNYETSLKRIGETVLITEGDGCRRAFYRKSGGGFQGYNGTMETIVERDEAYLLKNRESEIHTYSKEGFLLSIENSDREGISFSYYQDGRLESVKSSGGGQLLYEYDGEHRLTGVTDHAGRKVWLRYQNDKLTAARNPAGDEWHYRYSQAWELGAIVSPNGITMLENAYDGHHRVLTQRFPDGGSLKYEYLDEKGCVIVTEQNGNRVICEHDGRYRSTKVLYGDGAELFTYNDQNQKTSYTDKRENKNTFEYDDRGNLTCFKNAEGVSMNLSYASENKLIQAGLNGAWMYRAEYDEKGHQKAMTDVLGGRTEFIYDDKGNITEFVREDKSRTRLEYDGASHVTSVLYPGGGRITYEYDSLHRVSKSTDGNGNATLFFYNEKDELIRVTNPMDKSRYYEYDSNGNMAAFTDFDGSGIRILYNDMNKPVCIRDKNGNETKIEYDKMLNPVRITDPEGGVTACEYDKMQRITSVAAPDGGVSRFEYDPCGNLIRRRMPGNHVYELEYDKVNRPVQIKEPKGTVMRAAYNQFGQVESITWPDALKESYEYDRLGRLLIRTDRQGYRIYLGYNSLGLLESVADDRGWIEKYTYYPGGLLRSEHYPDGVSRTYTYDGNRNVSTLTDQNSCRWEFSYDALGRMTEAKSSEGAGERYEYDPVGNLVRVQNGENETFRYEYSPMGELTCVIDPMEGKALYSYDKKNQLTGIFQSSYESTDAGGIRKTIYERDAVGRITCITDALGSQTRYAYDGNGNILSVLDADGNLTRFAYHADGTQKQAWFSDGKTVKMQYDCLKRLTELEDWLGVTKMERDALGRITSVQMPEGDVLGLIWSQRGECLGMDYPGGKRVRYEYNSASQLIGYVQGGHRVSYGYYENGLLGEKLFSEGTHSRFEYNGIGQVARLCHGDGSGLLSRRTFTYDRAGRRRTALLEGRAEGEAAGSYEYGYTPLGCLEKVIKDGKTCAYYKYDHFGNRIHGEAQEEITEYAYNSLNQLVSSVSGGGQCGFRYDRRGNLTEESREDQLLRTFRFGAGNCLEEILTSDRKLEFRYDGFGNRVGESCFDAQGRLLETVRYISHPTRDFNNLLCSIRGDERVDYFWDKGLVQSSDGSRDEFYYLDEMLTPVGVFGKTKKLRAIGAFGEGDVFTGTDRFGFTGYRAEGANGIMFAQRREYMPDYGRFLSPDPMPGNIWRPLTQNTYAYCMGDPINYGDYTGAIVAWLAGGIIGALANMSVKVAGDVANSVKEGKWTGSSWQSYVGTAIGGFASGTTIMITGNSALAGAAGAGAESFVSGGLDLITRQMNGEHVTGGDFGSLLWDTSRDAAAGGAGGFVFGNASKYFKFPVINSGRGSYQAVWKQMATKAQRGLIKNVSARTMMKGLVAYGGMRFLDTLTDQGRKFLWDSVADRGMDGFRDAMAALLPDRNIPASSGGTLTGNVTGALSMIPSIRPCGAP